ncbi:MAG: DUF5683 domain-containing protein [Bacteroidales bacterium]
MKRLIIIYSLYLCIGSIFAQHEKGVVGTSIASDSLKTGVITPKVSKNIFAPKSDKVFAPVPAKAVLLSAIFPGLGQIYNRKYWKLPLVYGGFVGLSYGLTWNNSNLKQYTAAYNDIVDTDPSTTSYLTLLPQTMKDAFANGTLTQERLTSILKNQKDYLRRNRDLTIISMFGLYFVTMIDAYVDAQLFEFDISPDLSMKIEPTMIRTNQIVNRTQALGLQCSINF